MKSEEKISFVIKELEFKLAETKHIKAAFPEDDIIVKVIDGQQIRYHSSGINKLCNLIDINTNRYNLISASPHIETVFEFNISHYKARIYSEPYEIELGYKTINLITLFDYEKSLREFNFSDQLIRLVDAEIADKIIKKHWEVDNNTISPRVKKFIVFS